MEEILASIRRIIADDEASGGRRKAREPAPTAAKPETPPPRGQGAARHERHSSVGHSGCQRGCKPAAPP